MYYYGGYPGYGGGCGCLPHVVVWWKPWLWQWCCDNSSAFYIISNSYCLNTSNCIRENVNHFFIFVYNFIILW